MENVSLIVLHFMPFQKGQELLLKSLRTMMLRLRLDVRHGPIHLRDSETESTVALLPAEISVLGNVSWTHSEEPPLISWTALATAMVAGSDKRTCTWSATPPIALAVMPFSHDPADERPQTCLEVGRNAWLPSFGAEGAME